MGSVTKLEDFRRARYATAPRFPENREERARRYRLRADELRAIAEEVMLKETCLTLLSLAESYDQMARTVRRMRPAKNH